MNIASTVVLALVTHRDEGRGTLAQWTRKILSFGHVFVEERDVETMLNTLLGDGTLDAIKLGRLAKAEHEGRLVITEDLETPTWLSV